MSKIDIFFPDQKTYAFEKGKPIVILGANGAGKTRLSVKIEELNDKNFSSNYTSSNFLVQRIAAQKSLSISQSIIIKGLEASEREAFAGTSEPYSPKRSYRYHNNPATNLLQDYNNILSYFFSKNNNLLEEYHKLDKHCIDNGQPRPELIKTLIEQAEEIWSYLLPNREIDLSGNEVHVMGTDRYHGKEMSDGERVILYMIVQALVVKENSLIIIDEPELHIHKAILNKLWDKLEEVRQDCIFMYITHDLDFAISRNINEIIWVKSYDGKENWELDFLEIDDFSDLPQELLFEIIGTQKKIVFVEGTKSSLDYLLYQEIYKEKDYHVIPCGGCTQVIDYVKAKKGYATFSSIQVCGVIDRDYRTQNEIEELSKDNIYCLEVAEVENLFVVPELLEVMQNLLGCDPTVLEEAKTFIIGLFNSVKDQQISEALRNELKYKLRCIHFDKNEMTADKILIKINNVINKTSINEILQEKMVLFSSVKDLKDILKILNFKDLSKKISSKFSINKNDYPKKVINYIKYNTDGARQKIIEAVESYIPNLP